MKTIKIIDLLNMISKGEEVPKKIKYENKFLYFDNEDNEDNNYHATFNYYDEEGNSELFTGWVGEYLNDEVEIIEPQPTEEEIKEYTNKFLEVWEPISKQFGKLFDELIRIKNDLGLNEDNIKEEPQKHKIPEKIKINDDGTLGFPNGSWTARNMDKAFAIKINEIMDKVNDLEKRYEKQDN